MRITASLFLFIVLLTQACEPAPKESVKIHALYHWTSEYAFYDQRDFYDSAGVDHLFIRLFDIKYNPAFGPYPEAKFSTKRYRWGSYDYMLDTLRGHAMRYTPVVYVQETVLRRVEGAELDSLAADLVKQVKFMLTENRFPAVDELQIDCDWTRETRDKYFRLLEGIKHRWSGKLSVTVKMYQYKYREKMGIPPADRAVLMCYNLEDLKDSSVGNSIFSKAEFDRYMTRNKYPLPLDFALPAFSWARIYQPLKGVELVNGFRRNYLESYEFDSLSANSFRINKLKDNSDFYEENTLIKLDEVDASDWQHIYQKSLDHINSDTTRYIYYHLSSNLADELQTYLADSTWHRSQLK